MSRLSAFPWASASRALLGQADCGDAAWTWSKGQRLQVAVIDGLGHGREAAAASKLACQLLDGAAGANPGEQLRALHAGLSRTRGAALALGDADLDAGLWTWCGVGNISGLLIPPQGPAERLLCVNGIVGSNHLPPPRLRTLPLPAGSLLLLHSDGLHEIRAQQLPVGPSLQAWAEQLLVLGARGDDDALVWVGRADA